MPNHDSICADKREPVYEFGRDAPIPGLPFTLPEGAGATAIVTLNVPNPYAQGNDYPGGNFAIGVMERRSRRTRASHMAFRTR